MDTEKVMVYKRVIKISIKLFFTPLNANIKQSEYGHGKSYGLP